MSVFQPEVIEENMLHIVIINLLSNIISLRYRKPHQVNVIKC